MKTIGMKPQKNTNTKPDKPSKPDEKSKESV